MMLANISEADFMLKLIGALMVLGQGITIWLNVVNRGQRREISPSPLIVTGAAEFAHKKELDQHIQRNNQEHDNLFKKLGGVERGHREEVLKLNATAAALTSSNEQQNEQLAEMRETLKDMPGEIIALLKNTGAIK